MKSKIKKVSNKTAAKKKGGYVWEGRRGSENIHDRRPGSINIGPNTGTWSNGDRRIESGVNVRSEMGTGRNSGSSSGSGANRFRAGRGKTFKS